MSHRKFQFKIGAGHPRGGAEAADNVFGNDAGVIPGNVKPRISREKRSSNTT
jgi:hypothetical protein